MRGPAAPALRAVVLGRVDRLEADDSPRVIDVAIAPAIARGDEEDVESKGRRGHEAALDHARHVALAAPHRELTRLARAILGAHAADAQADHRQAVRVGILTRERFAPRLARAVQT